MCFHQRPEQALMLKQKTFIDAFIFSSPLVSYSNDVASVSKACFVTAGAISMKLGVRIPLGNFSQISAQSDLAILEKQLSAVTPELNAWIISKF
jgi:hypothetical protein